MNLSEYASYDGLALAALIARGEITAAEVCALSMLAIESMNPRLNFAVQAFPERAESLGDNPPLRGRLSGVPTLIKDFYKFEKGTLSEGGSELTRGLAGPYDSELVVRMRRAGLVTLGRSTVPELAYSSTCNTRIQGLTRNPWNPDTYPGGSSSGAVVAVAAGVVPIAHASDGGGSIRSPASYTGLVGLKPTRGRVSDGPGSADPTGGMATHLAVTRTVRDTAAMLDALAGPAIGDPHLAPPTQRSFVEELDHQPSRLRIKFTVEAFDGGPVDPEIAQAVRNTAALLQRVGHDIEEDSPRLTWEPSLQAVHVVWAAGSAHGCDALGRLVGREPSPDNLMRTSWALYQFGKKSTAADYLAALDEFNRARRAAGRFFQTCDILMTPTCTQLAQPHAQQDQNLELEARQWTDLVFKNDVFSPLFNVTGQPAISLPLHQARDGSQIGVQLVARFGEDALLLQLAGILEKALSWADRRPMLHVSSIR